MLRSLLAASLLLLPFADAHAASPPGRPSLRAEVEAFIKEYIEAVNRLDVAVLMGMTSRKPEVSTISDGQISRGWEEIRADADKVIGMEGTYRFTMGAIDVVPLGASHALAHAPYTVTVGTDRGVVTLPSAMSLVLEKSGGKWLILHDHMSTKLDPDEEGD